MGGCGRFLGVSGESFWGCGHSPRFLGEQARMEEERISHRFVAIFVGMLWCYGCFILPKKRAFLFGGGGHGGGAGEVGGT